MATRYITKHACKGCGFRTSVLHSGQVDIKPLDGVVYSHSMGSLVVNCRGCHKPMYVNAVRSKFSAKRVCSDRCESSHGTICECSCGGKNHGAAFA